MVQVTLKAVRVYGSAAYKNDVAQSELPTHLITLDPYRIDDAGNQGRALIYLGSPVLWVKEASRIRQAIGYIVLNWFRGISVQSDSDTAINQALQELDFTKQWQDSWYVTIVLDQDVDFPDEAILNNEHVWLDSNPNAYEQADNFERVAVPHLDRLAVLASTVIVPDALETVIMADHVFFATPDRRAFGLPKSHLSARLQVSHALNNLDLSALEMRLRMCATLTKDALEWLDLVTPWWLAGLREQDSWRAFAQLFTGLELLHSRLVKRYYPRVVGSSRIVGSDSASRKTTPILAALFDDRDWKAVKACSKLPQRGDFAILALALFPRQADADFNTFMSIKHVRDAVAHGEQKVDATTFPVSELRSLFGRYLDAAIQEHLSSPIASP